MMINDSADRVCSAQLSSAIEVDLEITAALPNWDPTESTFYFFPAAVT